MNFKKIASIAASVLMAGMSMGLASAAAFPAPFVQNGSANAAIVWGTGQGVSQTDYTAASNIAASLANSVTPTGTTNISGENVLLQSGSNYLTLGSGVSDSFGRVVTKTDMPTLLADGTYTDSGYADHDYTQQINVANLSLQEFDLSQYNQSVGDTTPAIGIPVDGTNLLNYTLTFSKPVNSSLMGTTTLDFMGTSYAVLKADTSGVTLFSNAASATTASGVTSNLVVNGKTYTVVPTVLDSSDVMFTVNGQTTDTLQQGAVVTLADGSSIAVQKIAGTPSYAGAPTSVEFSIGNGKIYLPKDGTVQVNSNSVNGLTSNVTYQTGTSADKITSIALKWAADNQEAITQSNSLTMPALNGLKLSFTGMAYPSTETTTVSQDTNTAAKISTETSSGTVNLDVVALDSAYNYTVIGKSSPNYLLKTSNTQTLSSLSKNDEFVVSWKNSKSSESHVYKVGSFTNNSNTLTVDLIPQDGSSAVTLTSGTSMPIGQGNIVLAPTISYSGTSSTLSLVANNAQVSFNQLYTAKGMQITLPWVNTTTQTTTNSTAVCADASTPTGTGMLGYNFTYVRTGGTNLTCTNTPSQSYNLVFREADKDGTIANGDSFNVQLGVDSNNKVTIDGTNVTNGVQEGSSNVEDYYVYSPLATEVKYDSTSQGNVAITYHGSQTGVTESYGKLYLASPSATVSNGAGSLGNIIYKDSEVSSITADNVIIVGGSCINSAAATVLGVSAHTCGDAFTQATKVGAGQYLIEGFNNPGLGNAKYALVVAGYSAADTTNAATYLTMKNPDTSQAWIGTSATEATQQVVSK